MRTTLFVKCLIALSTLWLLQIHNLKAQDKEPILLWPDGAPLAKGQNEVDQPTLTAYLVAGDQARPAVVVCPGGGYAGLAMDHEGHQVAQWLNRLGIHAFILKYRLGSEKGGNYRHPAPMLDGQRAIRMVRSKAEDWKVDRHRVGVLGFSAGGHLASTLGTHFDVGNDQSSEGIEQQSCRPDFMVLAYPVISFTAPFTHQGSRRNLLGNDPSTELKESLSNDLQVTAQTPPTFLVTTDEDKAVPAENTISFYLALRQAGVATELHTYQKGRHGLGLGQPGQPFANWPQQCAGWFRANNIIN